MPVSVQRDAGKRDQQYVKPADDDGIGSRLIFVTDKTTLTSFLVDTGADISVYPCSKVRQSTNKCEYELFADNGTRISMYRTIAVTHNMCLRRAFIWRFVIAEVQSAIICVDFLSHYRLLLDPRNKRLIDSRTHLTAKGYTDTADGASIRTIVGESVYHGLLMELPHLTREPVFERELIRHGVVQHIETTSGPPVCSKPRRLYLDSLKEVKTEFLAMIEQGVMGHRNFHGRHPCTLYQKRTEVCDYVATTAR